MSLSNLQQGLSLAKDTLKLYREALRHDFELDTVVIILQDNKNNKSVAGININDIDAVHHLIQAILNAYSKTKEQSIEKTIKQLIDSD